MYISNIFALCIYLLNDSVRPANPSSQSKQVLRGAIDAISKLNTVMDGQSVGAAYGLMDGWMDVALNCKKL